MCSRATCHDCNKPTYRGCGMHVEQVLGDVPRTERCRCREEANEAKEAKKTARGPSVIDRLWPFSSR